MARDKTARTGRTQPNAAMARAGPRPGQARDRPAVSWWAAVSVGRTDTFLGERHRRIARRRGKKPAIVAIGRAILVTIRALLSTSRRSSSTSAPTATPAPTPERKVRQHVRELQVPGYTVTLDPAARSPTTRGVRIGSPTIRGLSDQADSGTTRRSLENASSGTVRALSSHRPAAPRRRKRRCAPRAWQLRHPPGTAPEVGPRCTQGSRRLPASSVCPSTSR
jgi:hypothetical protein